MSDLSRILRGRRRRLAAAATLALLTCTAATALAAGTGPSQGTAPVALAGLTGTRTVACTAGTLSVSRATTTTVRLSCSHVVSRVGAARTFTSTTAHAVARTGLPQGTVPGTLLIATVEAPASSTVTMAGWNKAYQTSGGSGTGAIRLGTWWRITGEGETAPTAAVKPAAPAMMITVGFSGIDAHTPVAGAVATAAASATTASVRSAAATVPGAASPAGVSPPGSTWVLAAAAVGTRARLTPPASAALITSASLGHEVRTALAQAPEGGSISARSSWATGAARSALVGALVVRPATAAVPPGAVGIAAGVHQQLTCATGPVTYSLVGATAASIVCPPAPVAPEPARSTGTTSRSAPSNTAVATAPVASTSSTGSSGATSPATSTTGTSTTGTSTYARTETSTTASSTAASSTAASSTAPTASSSTGSITVPASGVAPSAPTAVCDTSVLAGPSSAPAGAVTVTPAQNLADVVRAHAPGTTYWLAAGTHVLGSDQYAQVQPHDGDTFIGAPGAVLDGRRVNRYAFTTEAVNVTISHLTVQHFGAVGGNPNEGAVNHDSGRRWTISGNTIQDNAGAGVMIGPEGRVTGNCIRRNGQYGFNGFYRNGDHDVVLDGNEIAGNNTDDWERRQPGCGCTGGGKFWATRGARVANNYVHDNRGVGLWADSNNTDFLFQGNYISGNDAEGLMYETSYNATMVNNTFVRNAVVAGPDNPGFPVGAIYLSESGGDSRVAGSAGSAFRIAGNVFVDNWAGIVAWENADRFAGSPANSSTGMTTLVNPGVVTVQACGTPSLIAKTPYLDDCRWKTQNLLVEDNTFTLDPASIPRCTAANGCGFNGLFSNYGSYPSWSPYQGQEVEENITYHQNNVWRHNSYRGPWTFMIHDQATRLSWSAWRAAPYGQDAGSSMR
ncbi:MAG TPA: right-handed parallel beta-helix repeat-containing protein [Kineosporiaceae bacterium]